MFSEKSGKNVQNSKTQSTILKICKSKKIHKLFQMLSIVFLILQISTKNLNFFIFVIDYFILCFFIFQRTLNFYFTFSFSLDFLFNIFFVKILNFLLTWLADGMVNGSKPVNGEGRVESCLVLRV